MLNDFHKETKWVVRIKQDYYNQVYFRNDMSNEFFNRWQWYFEYRAALLKVQNPKSKITYEVGAYEKILPAIEYEMKLKNIIKSRKSKLTEFGCKLDFAVKNWNELFPIEQNPYWSKVQAKLKRLEEELKIAMLKLEDLQENGYKEENQPIACMNPSISTGY